MKSPWIDAEDYYPEENVRVLVILSYPTSDPIMLVAFFRAGNWYVSWDEMELDLEEVLAWMPIPRYT